MTTTGERGQEGIEGPKGERGKRGFPGRSMNKHVKFAFIALTIVFFVILLGFGIIINNIANVSKDNVRLAKANIILTKENKNRIKDIQDSRVASCEKTYSGIHEVFQPFFPPPPRTAEQRKLLKKFDSTIIKLRNGCLTQTKPKDENKTDPDS